jgi:hypothetical protein
MKSYARERPLAALVNQILTSLFHERKIIELMQVASRLPNRLSTLKKE